MHRAKLRLGVTQPMDQLYESKEWPKWDQHYDTIHLLTDHRYYLDPHFKEYPEINERNIQHYPYMFGKLARRVIPPNRLLSPSTDFVKTKRSKSLKGNSSRRLKE